MTPYLSVVAASRNDDHGGDPLHRTQIFINCFAEQCDKYKLPAELILVDWNPVPDRPGLAAVLHLPPQSKYCSARVITVPTVLHRTVKYGDRLAFFQMIAKNAGIRRAHGSFVLATNIDIIFSDELMAFLSKQSLNPNLLYRVDRYDIEVELPVDARIDAVLDKAWRNIIRTNRRANLPEVIDSLYGYDPSCRNCEPQVNQVKQSDKIDIVKDENVWQLRPHPSSPIEHLNTNACGDFTLLSKKGWEAIRGYPDFEAFSFNIDSMGLVMAHYHGYRETSLLPPCVCFHIEHGLGSGYTPEGEQTLFDRIRKKRILSPDWPVLNIWVEQMRKQQRAIQFNRDNWGLADYTLPEQPMGTASRLSPEEFISNAKPVSGSVASLYPEYDLDSATLFYERESRQAANSQATPAAAKVNATPIALRETNSTDFNSCGDVFDHEHDSYSILDQYANGESANNRPLVVWGSATHFEQVQSLLAPHVGREVIAGNIFSANGSSAEHSRSYDGFLLATDPRQMVLDLHKHKLLTPRNGDSELVIWVHSNDHPELRDRRWLPAVKLARRLLGEVGWRVVVESQSELG